VSIATSAWKIRERIQRIEKQLSTRESDSTSTVILCLQWTLCKPDGLGTSLIV